jgi:Tol biopolymer transport system component
MSRTGPVVLIAALSATLLTSCRDEPSLTEPDQSLAPSMQVLEFEPEDVDLLIAHLYPDPGLINSAQKKWRNIQRQMDRDPSAAQQQAIGMVDEALVLLADGRLLDPDVEIGGQEIATALDGVNLLAAYLFSFTGMEDIPEFDEEWEDSTDQGSGIITPESGGTVTTENGWARVSVEPEKTDQNVFITILLIDDDNCDPSQHLKTSLGCWDFEQYGGGEFERTVEICVADPGPPESPGGLTDQEYYVELRVHKQDETTLAITALPYAPSTLDCTGFLAEEPLAAAGPGEDRSVLSSLASRVAGLLLPKPLVALFQELRRPPLGIGGTTGSFTWMFGAVPQEGAEYDDIPVGTGPDALTWQVVEPEGAVDLCNAPGGLECPGGSVTSVEVSAQAVTETSLAQPPWSAVYFYYKPRGLSGPITFFGSSDAPLVQDDGFNRFYTWTVTLAGEEVPDDGEIDVFAVGVPPESYPVYATEVNSNITVVSASPLALPFDLVWEAGTGTGDGHIYLLRTDSDTPENLTPDTPGDAGTPSWSPTGDTIVFAANWGGTTDLWMMFADGANQALLLDDPDYTDNSPVRSRTSDAIAFVRWYPASLGDREIMVRADGGAEPVNLTNHDADDFHPAWSPDGSRIAFTSDRDGSLDIFVMNADGSGPVNLTPGESGWDAGPDWSPDGSKIVFSSDRAGPDWDIWVMNADGSNLVNLTEDDKVNYNASWSPDGEWIAFERYVDEGVNRGDIFIMRSDGSQMTRITEGPLDHRWPRWRPVAIEPPMND